MADWAEEFKKKLGEGSSDKKPKADMNRLDETIREASDQVQKKEEEMQKLQDKQNKLLQNINEKVQHLKTVMQNAREATEKGDFTVALELWGEVLALDPDNVEAGEKKSLCESSLPAESPASEGSDDSETVMSESVADVSAVPDESTPENSEADKQEVEPLAEKVVSSDDVEKRDTVEPATAESTPEIPALPDEQEVEPLTEGAAATGEVVEVDEDDPGTPFDSEPMGLESVGDDLLELEDISGMEEGVSSLEDSGEEEEPVLPVDASSTEESPLSAVETTEEESLSEESPVLEKPPEGERNDSVLPEEEEAPPSWDAVEGDTQEEDEAVSEKETEVASDQSAESPAEIPERDATVTEVVLEESQPVESAEDPLSETLAQPVLSSEEEGVGEVSLPEEEVAVEEEPIPVEESSAALEEGDATDTEPSPEPLVEAESSNQVEEADATEPESSHEQPVEVEIVDGTADEEGEEIPFSQAEIDQLLAAASDEPPEAGVAETPVEEAQDISVPVAEAPPNTETGEDAPQTSIDSDAPDFSQDDIDALLQGSEDSAEVEDLKEDVPVPESEEVATSTEPEEDDVLFDQSEIDALLSTASEEGEEDAAAKDAEPNDAEVPAEAAEIVENVEEDTAPPADVSSEPTPSEVEVTEDWLPFDRESFLKELETDDDDLAALDKGLVDLGGIPESEAAPSVEDSAVSAPGPEIPEEEGAPEQTVLQEVSEVPAEEDEGEAALEAALAEIDQINSDQLPAEDNVTETIMVSKESGTAQGEAETVAEEEPEATQVVDSIEHAKESKKSSKMVAGLGIPAKQLAILITVAALIVLVFVGVITRLEKDKKMEQRVAQSVAQPESTEVVRSKLTRGEMLAESGEFDEAVDVLLTLQDEFPSTSSLRNALLEAGNIVYDQIEKISEPDPDLYHKAARLYDKLIEHFPKDDETETAYFRAAECYVTMQLYSRAADYYNVLIHYYPESRRYEEAAFQKARMDMLQDRYPEARDAFLQIIMEDQDSAMAKLAQIEIARSYHLEAKKFLAEQAARSGTLNLSEA